MNIKNGLNHFRRKYLKNAIQNVGKNSIHKSIVPIKEHDIQRILISRPNHRLGNQLLITPLVNEVAAAFPNAKIDILSKGGLAPIIFKNFTIHQFITQPKKPLKALGQYFKSWLIIAKTPYDLAINVEKTSASGRISIAISKAKWKIFGDHFPETLLENDHVHMAKNAVYNFKAFLKRAGYLYQSHNQLMLDIKLDEKEKLSGKKILSEITNDKFPKTIGFFTFATGAKCYSTDWWSSFYQKFSQQFEGFNLIEILPVENVSQLKFILPSYYSKEIREIASVMHACDLIIAADSGMMHLAVASDVPTIGLFEVTSTEMYGPFGNKNTFIDTKKQSQDDIILAMKKTLIDLYE